MAILQNEQTVQKSPPSMAANEPTLDVVAAVDGLDREGAQDSVRMFALVIAATEQMQALRRKIRSHSSDAAPHVG